MTFQVGAEVAVAAAEGVPVDEEVREEVVGVEVVVAEEVVGVVEEEEVVNDLVRAGLRQVERDQFRSCMCITHISHCLHFLPESPLGEDRSKYDFPRTHPLTLEDVHLLRCNKRSLTLSPLLAFLGTCNSVQAEYHEGRRSWTFL